MRWPDCLLSIVECFAGFAKHSLLVGDWSQRMDVLLST